MDRGKSFPIPFPSRSPTDLAPAQPEGIDDAYWEFSEDIGRYISTAEGLTTPYTWGVYDTLVLPPSFPYGGEYFGNSPMQALIKWNERGLRFGLGR
jgi:hypothetical protein